MNDFIIYLFAIITSIQIGYYGFFFIKFSLAKTQPIEAFDQPISVIIACKNEAENLEKNITKWVNQDYSNFEILFINDASTDETQSLLQYFSEQYKVVSFVDIPDYSGNKKNALSVGIPKAKYTYLLFTDADCVPESNQWIREMSKGFSIGKEIVLGYGKYESSPTFLNKLIRYETLLAAWQYFSYTLQGLPYMGVGRNIAYTKQIFTASNGFSKHTHIASGDDDLFVSQAANAHNVFATWTQESHTISKPKNSFKSWFWQKRRHITTATSYKHVHQFLLGLFFTSQIAFYALFLGILIFMPFHLGVLFLGIFRFIVFYISLIPVSKKLNETDLVYIAPLLEVFLIVFQGFIFISNLIVKPKSW